MADISKTTSLKNFLNNIGSTVFLLNTICVGLDIVRKENVKTYDEGLRVSWSSNEPENDAQRARIYANKSSLTFCVNALEEYIKSLNIQPQLIKDETILKELVNSISIADRFTTLLDMYKPECIYWGPIVRLTIAWRNRIIHSYSKVTLSNSDFNILKASQEDLFKNHSGLKIDETLKRYENNEGPTLKDVSSLISILIKSVRFIDSKLIENHLNKTYMIELLINSLSISNKNPISEVKNIWNLPLEKREKKITNIYLHSGIISGNIVDDLNIALINEVSNSDVNDIVKIGENVFC